MASEPASAARSSRLDVGNPLLAHLLKFAFRKRGWRRISAARRSAPARLACTVSMMAVAPSIPLDTSICACRRLASSCI